MFHFTRTSLTLIAALLLVIARAGCAAERDAPGGTLAAPAAAGTSTDSAAHPGSTTSSAIFEPAAIPDAFSGSQAYQHVQQLAGVIGSRPTGTQSERDGANYIAKQLSSYGYQVEQPPFQFQSYQENGSSLEVASPGSQGLNANVLYFSPGGDLTGVIIDAGIGRPEDFPSGLSTGKIALIERGTLTFSEKVDNAARAGASGVLVYNNVPGQFFGNLGQLGKVPAVSISQEDGTKLRSLLQQGQLQAHLNVKAGVEDIRSQNVVARGAAPCRVLIGGHYDSVSAGPGANDNASGTAVMLELARVFKDHARRLGLCFAAFGGEELGLWGSRRYAEALTEAERQALTAMINLDMVGVGEQWRITASSSLHALVTEIAKDQPGTVNELSGGSQRGGGSDHASFNRVGVPVVFFYRSEDPRYHSPEDKAEHIDPQALDAAGKMAAQLMLRLADQSGLSSGR